MSEQAVATPTPQPAPGERKKSVIPSVNPYMAIFVMCSNAPLKCKHTELLPPKFGVDPRTGEPAIINKCPECNYIFIQSKIHAQGDCLPADAPVRNRLSEVFQKGK